MQTNKSQAQNESVHCDWEIINLFSTAPAQGSFEEHRAQHKPARTRQLLRAILPLPRLPQSYEENRSAVSVCHQHQRSDTLQPIVMRSSPLFRDPVSFCYAAVA